MKKQAVFSALSLALALMFAFNPLSAFAGPEEEAELLYTKGQIKYNDGEYEEAEKFFEKAFELNPQRRDVAEALGLARLQTQKYEKAIPALEASYKTAPENHQAAFDLGMAYHETGKFEESKKTLAAAIEKGAEGSEFHYYLGLNYFHLGDYEKALSELAKSREKDDEFKQVSFFYQGFVHKAMKDDEASKTAWKMSIDAAPETEVAKTAQELIDGKIAAEAPKPEEGYPLYFINISLGSQYDSNVIFVPYDSVYEEVITAQYGDKKDDFKAFLNLNATVNPYVEGGHLIGVNLNAYTNFHFTPDIRAMNFTNAGLGFIYEYLSGSLLFRLPIYGRGSFLSDSFDYYNSMFGAIPTVQYQWNSLTLTRFLVNAGFGHYAEVGKKNEDLSKTNVSEVSDRTGLATSADLGQVLQLMNNNINLGLSYRFSLLNASGNDQKNIGNGAILNASFRTPINLYFDLNAGAIYRMYLNTLESDVIQDAVRRDKKIAEGSTIPENDLKRRDTFIYAALDITYFFNRDEWGKGFYIGVGAQYNHNLSGVSFYQYNRHAEHLTFGVTF